MSKVAVVWWSGTGNTEKMANAVAEGAREKGAEVMMTGPAGFGGADVSSYDAIAFGCPAMGAEQLEEEEYQPMWDEVKGSLSGKKVALFGSYGWGDGEWMRLWADEARSAGADLVSDGLMLNGEPDEDGEADCKALGGALA
ncbi:MAG: flavodoxin [Eubacteriales bacterium]|nr:flavodoxin [Eubacteriales bacterium]